MARKPPIYLAALLTGFLSSSVAMAQSIPLPKPAPQAKSQATANAQGNAGRQAAASAGIAVPPQSAGVAQPSPSPFGGLSNLFDRNKPVPTNRLTAEQRSKVEQANAYLSNLRNMVGDFVQVGPDGSRTEGQIYLQKPGRVRFEYASPSPIELVSDGQSLVVRDRKLATQDLYPLGQTPLRFLLADQVDLLRDTNVVGVYSDDVFTSVAIEEKKTLGGTHKLMLMFGAQDSKLKQWTVTDPQGYDTTVALYNIDTSRNPDPGMFKINYERITQ